MQIIKQLRRTKGINQSDLAAAIGVSLRTIQLYEKKNANIPIKNLTKIADFFDLTIAELYMKEVNEEEASYGRKKMFSTNGNVNYHLPNGKYLVFVPVLFENLQSNFIKNFPDQASNKNFVKTAFVVDQFDEGGYMVFEIIGNAMNDGSIESIPHGALVLGKMIEKDIFLTTTGAQTVNKDFVFVCTTRIICKRFTGFDSDSGQVSCRSLNNSPEYKDFDMPASDILGVYEVVKKQI